VENGDSKSISLLVRRGADVNVKDDCGNTALHWVAKYDLTEECALLIEYGANVNAQDNDGVHPLDNAVSHSQPANVSLLLNHDSIVYYSEYLDDLLKRAISVLINKDQYYLGREPFVVINLLIEAGAEATDIRLSEDLERILSLRDTFNVSSSRSLIKESRNLNVLSSMVDDNTEKADLGNGCLREFSCNSRSQQEGKFYNAE
jgi:ankyrin repeat protein